jgi:hypothetical protein
MSAKKLQNKIFGTPSSSDSNIKPSSSADLGLTINIPKQATPNQPVSHTEHKPAPSTPTARGYKDSATHASLKYRDRLITQLKSEYQSVERHRLLQDERKERHWKRWGPYLSERQWVSRHPV